MPKINTLPKTAKMMSYEIYTDIHIYMYVRVHESTIDSTISHVVHSNWNSMVVFPIRGATFAIKDHP